jgi:4-hydroxy-2-oxoheptanedioate aldolase
MTLPVNAFKAALRAGKSQIAVWNTIPGPVVTEILAGSGFDVVVIDTEHSLTDVPDVLGMLQALEGYPVAHAVRPASNDPVLIKRLLDIGATTLIIPYVQSADEARAAVRAMRYAPEGFRGVSGATRAARYGAVTDYIQTAEAELCLVVQVETTEALSRIEDIAAVDGVDMIFIGPSDLAASMGYRGEPGHPAVKAAVEDAIRRIVAAGKPAAVLTLDPEFARRCIALGSTFTVVAVDIPELARAAKAAAAAFR